MSKTSDKIRYNSQKIVDDWYERFPILLSGDFVKDHSMTVNEMKAVIYRFKMPVNFCTHLNLSSPSSYDLQNWLTMIGTFIANNYGYLIDKENLYTDNIKRLLSPNFSNLFKNKVKRFVHVSGFVHEGKTTLCKDLEFRKKFTIAPGQKVVVVPELDELYRVSFHMLGDQNLLQVASQAPYFIPLLNLYTAVCKIVAAISDEDLEDPKPTLFLLERALIDHDVFAQMGALGGDRAYSSKFIIFKLFNLLMGDNSEHLIYALNTGPRWPIIDAYRKFERTCFTNEEVMKQVAKRFYTIRNACFDNGLPYLNRSQVYSDLFDGQIVGHLKRIDKEFREMFSTLHIKYEGNVTISLVELENFFYMKNANVFESHDFKFMFTGAFDSSIICPKIMHQAYDPSCGVLHFLRRAMNHFVTSSLCFSIDKYNDEVMSGEFVRNMRQKNLHLTILACSGFIQNGKTTFCESYNYYKANTYFKKVWEPSEGWRQINGLLENCQSVLMSTFLIKLFIEIYNVPDSYDEAVFLMDRSIFDYCAFLDDVTPYHYFMQLLSLCVKSLTYCEKTFYTIYEDNRPQRDYEKKLYKNLDGIKSASIDYYNRLSLIKERCLLQTNTSRTLALKTPY